MSEARRPVREVKTRASSTLRSGCNVNSPSQASGRSAAFFRMSLACRR